MFFLCVVLRSNLVWDFICQPRFSSLFLSLKKVRGPINRVTPLESNPCIRSIQPGIGTMTQSYASRVWLQSGGLILLIGIWAMVCYRVATTPDLHVGSEAIRTRPMICGVLYSKTGCRVQNDAFGHFVVGDMTNFHKATSNLRASATIIFLRIPTGPAVM